jgi:hypothetical protein
MEKNAVLKCGHDTNKAKKVGHIPTDPTVPQAKNLTVHQCEICGEYYFMIGERLVHKEDAAIKPMKRKGKIIFY